MQKYAVTGFIHSLLIHSKVLKSLENWFKKYLDEPPLDDFQYFTYKESEASIATRLLLYIITGKAELLAKNEKCGVLKRLLRGEH